MPIGTAVAMILLTVEVSSFYQEGSKGAELIPGARVIRRGDWVIVAPILMGYEGAQGHENW